MLIAGLFFSVFHSAHSATYIFASQVISAEDSKVITDSTIIVDNGVIQDIIKGKQQGSENDDFVDLTGHTLMPGFMDMHTHITYQNEGTAGYLKRFSNNEADYAIAGVHYAEKTLMAGFTTVRNLGDSYNETVALRNAIRRGVVKGPRIFTSGKSIAGGVLSVAKSGQNPQFMIDELEAIVQTAKDYEMTVAVHAHGKEGMKRAILAGVDSIEHGTYMDDEIFKLMRKHKVYYVPTISAGNFVAEKAKIDGYFPEIVRPKAAAIGPLIANTFSVAYENDILIAFGTDAGVSPHGDNALEFELMVNAGMSEMDAIRSATYHTSKLLKIDDRLGTITEGKLADLVAVEGDPLENIQLLNDIQFIMKDGQIYKRN